MNQIYKPKILIAAGLCFIILMFLGTRAKADNVTVTLEADHYQIVNLDNDRQLIEMDNFGNLLVPGKPMLPAKGFLIAIPPGTEVYNVTATSVPSIEIEGNYNITPAPPLTPTIDQKEYFQESMLEWQQNYDLAYASDRVYPEIEWKYTGTGALRKYSFVKVVFFPFSYLPQSGKLLFTSSLNVSIDCQTTSAASQNAERLMSDTVGDEPASEFLVNFKQAKDWYRSTTKENSSRNLYDYVIITTDDLVSALSNFVFWKETIGYNVRVETISWISSNYTGSDLPEKIRNFLIDKYPGIEWGIEYVLIVGDINNIPMRYCFPDSGDHNFPSDNYNPPSDYYYADLTGNWDSDGDGYYGEYNQDNVDFVPEIYVGRIPYSDSATVASICNKIANCGSEEYAPWKNNALLLGANLNFENEDGSENPATDAAYLMDLLANSVLPPECVSTTMYETQGLAPCPLPGDLPLTHANVLSSWQSNDYGIVTLMGHGNYHNIIRRWWNYDNNVNGIPETLEMQSENILLNADIATLDNAHPSIVFLNSCVSGAPDQNSLGKNLIKNGGVAIISPTRIVYYAIGWVSSDMGGIASIDYHFFDALVNSFWTVGRSLFYSSVYYYNNYFDSPPFSNWGWKSQQNLLAFQLYGDPAYHKGSVPTVPEVLAVSPLQGEINIPRAANISVTFDVPMDFATINDSTFIVNGSTSGPHLGQFFPDFDEVLFNPDEDFTTGEIVTVVLTTDIKSDYDLPLDSSYVWSFVTHVTNSTADFDSSFFVSTDDGAYAVYAADLDGDGDIDLATANTDANSVSILLNNGDGTFDYNADYSVGDGPRSIVAADLDNDNDVDIATANFTSEDITVLYNNGNGVFSPTRENFDIGVSPWAIVAAEFNGDGFIDLAVTTGDSDTVIVLLNAGDGTFPQVSASYDTEGGAWGIFSADFDGDNDIDLAVTTGNTGTFIILFNNGNGYFPPSLWASYDTEGGSWSVFGADFDGDRDIDLAVVDTVAQTVQFFLNVGNGAFIPVVNGSYDTEGGAWSVFGTDFDGDDDIDLAFAISDPSGTNNVSILFNNSDSTIIDSTIYMETATVHSTFGDSWDIVSADFNGDGSLDLAVANTDSDGVTILMNESVLYLFLPGDVNMYYGTWPAAATGPDVTYLVNYFRSAPLSQPCFLDGFWASADANGDCDVIGSDVTKLVNYFRGLTTLSYCTNYEPAWMTPADLPAEAPDVWPGCDE